MSLSEFKRLNVIADFEKRVHIAMINDSCNMTFTLGGYLVYLFNCKVVLNASEIRYIEDNYNDQKSYNCAFLELNDFIIPKLGFKFASHYKRAYEILATDRTHVKGLKYFIVIRSGLELLV